MSHAEAFENLRSFVIGLEIKARDLRKVVESDGKFTNGGIGERCARAIGAASAEQVTREMIAEVAEQDNVVRQAEETIQADVPVQEATEKYRTLGEYNQLALEDLEERLSAYGYVRPARVPVPENAAEVEQPAVDSSVIHLPAGATTAGNSSSSSSSSMSKKSTSTKQDDTRDGGGGDRGVGQRGGRASGGVKQEQANTPSNDSSYLEQARREEDVVIDGLAASSAAAVAAGRGEVRGEGEDTAVDDGEKDRGGGAVDFDVVTPAHPVVGVSDVEPEEEPGSPLTPSSPGLAHWEIAEGTREMPPRSLEALLAEKTAIGSPADASTATTSSAAAYVGGDRRRSSVSSNWSPAAAAAAVVPLTATEAWSLRLSGSTSAGISSRRQQEIEGGCGGGEGGGEGDDYGDACVGIPAEGARAGESGVEIWTWDRDSNPPTPARMSFEEEEQEERWTPAAGLMEGEAGTVSSTAFRGRKQSSPLGNPDLGLRSPLGDVETAHLVEVAMSGGRRPSVSDTHSEDYSSGSVTLPPNPIPIEGSSLQGGEAPLGEGLPEEGSHGDFWGETSPASPVVAPSRDASAQRSTPPSPETPATPEMLSPRFQKESDVGGSVQEGNSSGSGEGTATAAGAPSWLTMQSPSQRGTATTPASVTDGSGTAAGGGHGDDQEEDSRSRDNGTVGVTGGRPDESLDGYDSDACQTPELSSPLRSAKISARNLYVLTPSAARRDNDGDGDGDGGGNGMSGGGGGGYGSSDCDSDACPTPELSSPLRSASSAALCRRRLEEAGKEVAGGEELSSRGPLELVSEEEYAKAPKFLTIQVSRSVLNDTIENLNAYAAPRLAKPSELLLTVDEIMAIIDQGELSRTLLLSVASLKRVEMKGARMYRIRA